MPTASVDVIVIGQITIPLINEMDRASMAIKDGLQLWKALVSSGLEENRKNHLPGYDAELIVELKRGLYPHTTSSLERELCNAPPSPEAFLEVFFGALQPFSKMLNDVLGMFQDAGAKRSNENLRIAFNFDQASTALVLTLKQFRETEQFLRQVTRSIAERQWDSRMLFSFAADVGEVALSLNATPPQGAITTASVRTLRVREWAQRNGKPSWLPFPGFPKSDDVALDEAIRMCEALIRDMMDEVSMLGATYGEFVTRLRELPQEVPQVRSGIMPMVEAESRHPRRNFVTAALDFWPNIFAEKLCLAIESVLSRKGNPREKASEDLSKAIQTGFELPPRQVRPHVSLEQAFRDLVNLPIWKRRHELYAVWVASRIADAMQDLAWEWHPDGDALHFSFSGVELATVRSRDGSTQIFWTEKRTMLEGGGIFGRRHIQPDYRFMSVPTHRRNATTLVVECKQYRQWSKKNFGAALDDYAKGCPEATVILVNYGPTDRSILELVDASRRDRTILIGDFRPGYIDSLDHFRNVLRKMYTPRLIPRITERIELELSWGTSFRDLDLHLFIRSTAEVSPVHIGFGGARGTVLEPPWAEWPDDIKNSPPGVERINIASWLDAEYDVLVHDYSRNPNFPNEDVVLRLISSSGVEYHSFVPALSDKGGLWHVCRIHGTSGQIEEVNTVHTHADVQDLFGPIINTAEVPDTASGHALSLANDISIQQALNHEASANLNGITSLIDDTKRRGDTRE